MWHFCHTVSPGRGVERKYSFGLEITGGLGGVAVRKFLVIVSATALGISSAWADESAGTRGVAAAALTLDAAEAYVDVVRYTRLIALAEDNVRVHTSIAGDVRQRFEGGRSGEGDNEQARERLFGTRAVLAEFRNRLDDARAKYRRVVGLE